MPRYANRSGRVVRNVFFTGQDLPADQQALYEVEPVSDDVNPDTHYYDTVNEEYIPRPDLGTVVTWEFLYEGVASGTPGEFGANSTVDYAKVDDVPAGAVVTMQPANDNDPGRRTLTATVNDGFCTFKTDYPDTYTVTIDAFPYRLYTYTITAVD